MLPNPSAGTGPPGNPPPPPPPPPPGPPPGPGRQDRARTIEEAAAELGIGYHKLRKLVAGRAVQCVPFGRSVRFYDADIAAIKEQFRVTPRPAVQAVPLTRRGRAA